MRNVLLTIFGVLILDQASKIYIKSNFLIHEMAGSLGFIKFQFIENPGMAFGWTFGEVWGKIALSLFRIVAIVAIGFAIRNLIHNKAHKGLIVAVSLIMAGAIGNILDSAFYGFMFDRGTTWSNELQTWISYDGIAQLNFEGYTGLLQGCVVDMIHFEMYWPSWMPFGLGGEEIFPPVFNIADAAVSIGVAIIIIWNKRFFKEYKGFEVFKKQKTEAQSLND